MDSPTDKVLPQNYGINAQISDWFSSLPGTINAAELSRVCMQKVEDQDSPKNYHYLWFWRSRLPERKGQPCRVLARGRMNSVLVEFPDGFRVVTSRYAVRKKEDPKGFKKP